MAESRTLETNMNTIAALIRKAGLRVTGQRLQIAKLLFSKGHRHVTADGLRREADKAGLSISFGTIYNTLNQFTKIGLLRETMVEPNRTYFDTNTHDHSHFFVKDEGRLIDIDQEALKVEGLPPIPEGMRQTGMHVVIHLEKAR